METLDEFDYLLLRVIDETLRYALGDINTQIIFDYLEKNSCPFLEIPRKLDVFSIGLRNLVGTGRGQILGAGPILEKTIAEIFCRKLGMEFNESGPIALADYVKNLKEAHRNREVKVFER
jgi:hypothetical protein